MLRSLETKPAPRGIFFFTNPALSDYSIQLKCAVNQIPRGAGLVSSDLNIQIDPIGLRARIKDQIIVESGLSWLTTESVDNRGDIFLFNYAIIPSNARLAKDRPSRRSIGKKVQYRVTYNHASRNLRWQYFFSTDGFQRLVRVRGVCLDAPP